MALVFEKIDGAFIIVKCENCSTIHKKHKTYCKQYGNEYHFNPPITCSCGNVESIAYYNYNLPKSKPDILNSNDTSDKVKCPKCGCTQISANKRGITFTLGLLGTQTVFITCLKCGYRWKAGKN